MVTVFMLGNLEESLDFKEDIEFPNTKRQNSEMKERIDDR